MPVKQLDIAVIGDEELVKALRLAGISKYYMITGDDDIRENVRRSLTEVLAKPDVGIVVILEDYTQYVEDLMAQVRKGKRATPVIVGIPSKFGAKYPDPKEYYRAFIRKYIGFEVEI